MRAAAAGKVAIGLVEDQEGAGLAAGLEGLAQQVRRIDGAGRVVRRDQCHGLDALRQDRLDAFDGGHKAGAGSSGISSRRMPIIASVVSWLK